MAGADAEAEAVAAPKAQDKKRRRKSSLDLGMRIASTMFSNKNLACSVVGGTRN